MRRRFLYQDHFVAIARSRLGRARADVLLVDASYRRNATIARLSDALGVRLNLGRNEDGAIEAEAYELREGTRWHGASLHLESRLPETVQQHVPGRPLGDVVGGSGADSWPVLLTCDTVSGTTLMVDAAWVDARGIRLTAFERFTGPFRRACTTLAYDWRSHSDRSMLQPPGWTDLLVHACLIGLMVTTMLLAMAILPSHGPAGVVAAVPFTAVICWHTGAMIQGLRADLRRWPERHG